MNAEVLILEHEAAGLRERFGGVKRLIKVKSRRGQILPKRLFGRIRRNSEAGKRTDIDAGVALDALGGSERGFDIAVQASLHFPGGLFGGKAELDLDLQLF